MFHTSKPIIKHKTGLLNLASELQNVSKACKIMGVSRDTFYRYQELVETDGLERLINRERLSDAQIAALERKHEDDVACGEIETAHSWLPGCARYLHVGNLKGVGRIYQQTFIDNCSKVVH